MENIEQKIEEIKLNDDDNKTNEEIVVAKSQQSRSITAPTSKETQRSNMSIFSAISDFICCLAEKYADTGKFHELELYQVLVENTRIIHKEQINNHISLFREYFQKNIECILEKDLTKLDNSNIQYSEKVYINLKSIVDVSTEEDKKIIVEHMMVLGALLCPDEERVLDIIRKAKTSSSSSSSSSSGANLFETIFQQVNDTIANSDEENPMALLGNLLKSDFMNNIVNSVGANLENNNNNDLDMSNMIESLTGMIGSVVNNLNNIPHNGN